MNPSNDLNERIKLHEPVGVAGMLVFLAVSLPTIYTLLVARCYVVDLADHLKSKRKGGRHVP
jgi:hypothetical protein